MKHIISIGTIGLILLLAIVFFSQKVESEQQLSSLQLLSSADADLIETTHFLADNNGRPSVLIQQRSRKALLLTTDKNNAASRIELAEENIVRSEVSSGGSWFALAELNQSPERTLEISVYNNSGAKQYTILRPQPDDVQIPGLHLIEVDGSLIISDAANALLYRYDNSGNLLQTITLFEEAEYDLERVVDVSVAAETGHFAVAAGKHASAPAGSASLKPDADPQLFYFNKQGENQWTTALDGYNTLKCEIAPDASHIAVGSYTVYSDKAMHRVTAVVDNQANFVFSDDRLFKDAVFSADSRFLLLTENQYAQLVDLTNHDQDWEKNIPREQGVILERSIRPNGGEVAFLVAKQIFQEDRFLFTNPQVLRIIDGELQNQRPVADSPAGVLAIGYAKDNSFQMLLNNGVLSTSREN
ncbi:MAG: hypothetical protein ACRBF0_02745 [Calditrichia bacterium]